MSATDELRRLLDDRGVEWDEYGDGYTLLRHGGREYTVQPNVCNRLIVTNLTPEQAIAATLGSCNCSSSERTGTCHNISKVMDEHGQARFACSECGAWIDSRMLWNPEYRNGESPWVSGCKLNFCPNCGRRVVDA